MADTKTSALTARTADGTELVPAALGGANYRLTVSDIANLAAARVGDRTSVIAEYDFAVDGGQTDVDVSAATLGEWDEAIIIFEDLANGSADVSVRVSDDDLATVFSGASDYQLLGSNAADSSGSSVLASSGTATASAKSGFLRLVKQGQTLFGFSQTNNGVGTRRFDAASAATIDSFVVRTQNAITAGRITVLKKTYAESVQPIAGTAFPSSPTDGDRFYRTDRKIEYFYDSANAQWLSTTLYSSDIPINRGTYPITGTTAARNEMAHPGLGAGYAVWVEEFACTVFLTTTGSWSADLIVEGTGTTTIASISGMNAVTTWTGYTASMTPVAVALTEARFGINVTENSGASSVYVLPRISYRLIG